MARTIVTVSLIVLLNVLVGCEPANTGQGQLLVRPGPAASTTAMVNIENASESDIVEQMAAHRQSYRQALEILVAYYNKAGNHMKLQWAQKELDAVNTMPQYNYIIEAGIAGPELKATNQIAEASFLYMEGTQLEAKAGPLNILRNSGLLRKALAKYNEVIAKYPSSNVIDDAAYKAAGIYEYFGDYNIALVYFQRTYQWNPQTEYPARFREAYVLDYYLHDRAKALAGYQSAMESLRASNEHYNWQEIAKTRIAELTKAASESPK